MHNSPLPPRISVLFASLLLLILPAHAAAPADVDSGKSRGTTHTITITYNAAATPQWNYDISPANDAKKARVKKRDTIVWRCNSGDWTVFFKNDTTPLEGTSGGALKQFSGTNGGAAAGGVVSQNTKKGDVFTYGVSLIPPGARSPVVDDPQIIIEEN